MGCSCCFMLIAIVFVAVGALVAGLYFGVIDKDDVTSFVDTTQDFFDDILNTDPFSGGYGYNGTLYLWSGTDGKGGLELELLNALTDDWQPFFDQAVQDWNGGTPDALTLTTSRIPAEKECSHEDDKMKVCNGDYGKTGWRGINKFVTQNNQIVSSVAKMNEYYLLQEGNLYKQYTMCHEIGHGFGLPHTDENFNNPPLGDCLDYTEIQIAFNVEPGQVNYDKLANAYGVVGSQRVRRRAANRNSKTKIPAWVQEVLAEKTDYLESDLENAHEVGWVKSHGSHLGEHHTIDLGDGFSVHAGVLLAPN